MDETRSATSVRSPTNSYRFDGQRAVVPHHQRMLVAEIAQDAIRDGQRHFSLAGNDLVCSDAPQRVRLADAVGGAHRELTATVADAQEDLDFCIEVLGLRLVKKTVNFDDPSAYHLYYGDASGSPGSIVTFFYWPGRAARGRGPGTHSSGSVGGVRAGGCMTREGEGNGGLWRKETGPAAAFSWAPAKFETVPAASATATRDLPGPRSLANSGDRFPKILRGIGRARHLHSSYFYRFC